MAIRCDVATLGGGWNKTLHNYALAVRALDELDFADRNSWRFLGAMHGFDARDWQSLGLLTAGEPVPADIDGDYGNQCQHASWYFLPWHRGYVGTFEAIVAAKIKELTGDDWSLPYWNYLELDQPRRAQASGRLPRRHDARREREPAEILSRHSDPQCRDHRDRTRAVRQVRPRFDGRGRFPRRQSGRHRLRRRHFGRLHPVRQLDRRPGAEPAQYRPRAGRPGPRVDRRPDHRRPRPFVLAPPLQRRPAVGGLDGRSRQAHGRRSALEPRSVGPRLRHAGCRRRSPGDQLRRAGLPCRGPVLPGI